MPATGSAHRPGSAGKAAQLSHRTDRPARLPVVLRGRCPPPLGPRTPGKLSQRHGFLDREAIREVVRWALGRDVRHLKSIQEGYGGAVYLVQLEGGPPARVVFKAQLFRDTRSLDQEACFFEAMRRVGPAGAVPVPRLEVLDLTGERLPCPFYLAHLLPGRSLASRLATGRGVDLKAVAAAIGRVLARVHRVRPRRSTCGALTAGSRDRILSGRRGCTEKLEGERPFSPGAWTEEIVRRGLRVRDLGVVSPGMLDRWLRVVETFEREGELCFLHGDPSLSNFLFTGGRLSGVVDGSGTLGVRQDEVASALVYLWLAQTYVSRDAVEKAWTTFLRDYAESSEPRARVELPAEFLVKRIISRVDTYARIGRLGQMLPLLLSLWERLQAGAPELTGVLAPGSEVRSAASV